MEPYQNQNINVEMISYVVPLYVDNVTVGVVGMDINYDVIREIVGSIRVYSSGYAFLTDKQANIMYHPEFPIGTSISGMGGSLRSVADELQNMGGGTYLFSYTMRDEARKLAFCSLQNGMRLGITAPTADCLLYTSQRPRDCS